MEIGMYELVQKILYGVSFIAIGGALAIIFFFIFAPSILGSKTIHKQLEQMREELEDIKQHLNRIAENTEKRKD